MIGGMNKDTERQARTQGILTAFYMLFLTYFARPVLKLGSCKGQQQR